MLKIKKIETYLTLTGLIWRALSISFISWQYSLILLAADEYFFLYLQKAKKVNHLQVLEFSKKIIFFNYPLGWAFIASFIPWTHKLVPTNKGGWTKFCL